MPVIVPLLLITASLSRALALQCNTCSQRSCYTTNCFSLCGALTSTVYLDGRKMNNSVLGCGDTSSCLSESINGGRIRMTLNSLCCKTNQCITQLLPDLSLQPPNERRCFTCNGTDCSKTLACSGNETHCFTATAEGISGQMVVKGCSTRHLCRINGTQALLLAPSTINLGNFTRCCEGNLCNAALSWRAHTLCVLAILLLFCF